MQELLDLPRACRVAIVDGKRLLDLICQLLVEELWHGCLHDRFPVGLVSLPEDAFYGTIELRLAANCLKNLLRWCEVFLYCNYNWLEDGLEEKDDTFVVELRAEQVEKDVLAVALVELTALIGQLVEHWKGLRCVRRAGDHLSHA